MDERGYTLEDLRQADAPAGAEKFRGAIEAVLRREFGAFDPRREDILEAASARIAQAYGIEPDARTRALVADGLGDDEPTSWLDLILSLELTLAVRVEKVAPCGCVAYVDGTGDPCEEHHPDSPSGGEQV